MNEPAWKVLDPEIFDSLMLALGYAAGAAAESRDRTIERNIIRLVNELNLGNPNYRPYFEGLEKEPPR